MNTETARNREIKDSISFDFTVPCEIEKAYRLWTTEQGIKSFFSPDANVEFKQKGKFEIYFDMERPPGFRGSEGMTVMGMDEPFMFSFTWNFPPHLEDLRYHRTLIIVRFYREENNTRVTFTQHGFGRTGEWQEGVAYFTRAWGRIVIPNFRWCVENGPLNWEDPPDTSSYYL